MTPVGAVLLIGAAFVLYWIFRDARARDANPWLWVVALLAVGWMIHPLLLPVGVGVYLISRPKGPLKRCPHCSGPYLHWLAQCPKCGGPLKKDCHRCREAVDYEALRCPQCGAPLGN